jgi:gluconolactonase
VLKSDFFGATEGAVWVKKGQYLLFSDMAANRIYKWSPKEQLSVYMEKSGFTGTETPVTSVNFNGRFYVSLLRSNGLAIDHDGRLLMCTHGDRSLVRIEADGKRTTLADRYDGKRLNGPNDIAIKSDGSIYFSDIGIYPDKELPPSIYRLKDGKLQLLIKEVQGGSANGLAFSPDEKYLYVAPSFVRPPRIVRFTVQPDGTIADGQTFVDMGGAQGRGGPDGLKVDKRGNLWFGGPGGLWIVSPEGKHLGTILTSETRIWRSATPMARVCTSLRFRALCTSG